MKLKKIIFYLWLILVMGVITTYLLFPEKFSLSFIEETAVDYPIAILVLYYLIISFKGLTLMPVALFCWLEC